MENQNLKYHSHPYPGKIGVEITKKCSSQNDLSKAYTPGVADPCLEIKKNPETIWDYTSKGNSVAVITDGTAVLGLGDIGPRAGIPVMEGKAVLFKKFADIDAFPLSLNIEKNNNKIDTEQTIETIKKLEPNFGGINLEDIASPACFEIEKRLKKELSIPVFHDDQHGTAIISLAAIKNGLQLVNKKLKDSVFVINGAGAAGMACAELYLKAGVKKENIILCDIKGVLNEDRNDLTEKQNIFAKSTSSSYKYLYEAIKKADIFIGVSVGKCLNQEMIKSMNKDPIIFAMANPVPEISPQEAERAGARIIGTGRSDYPNQVNNVMGFPGIFRGSLDVRASNINSNMLISASEALADLANEEIDSDTYKILSKAYPEDFEQGIFNGKNPLKSNYVIPKPFDPRVVPRVAAKVAEAAINTNAARNPFQYLTKYQASVAQRIKQKES